MKAEIYSQIKTLVPITVDGIDFPESTLGAVVETYSNPEGYAVDLAIPDSQLVGGFRYHNVILTPEEFEVMVDQAQVLSQILDILEVYFNYKSKKNNLLKLEKFLEIYYRYKITKTFLLFFRKYNFFSIFNKKIELNQFKEVLSVIFYSPIVLILLAGILFVVNHNFKNVLFLSLAFILLIWSFINWCFYNNFPKIKFFKKFTIKEINEQFYYSSAILLLYIFIFGVLVKITDSYNFSYYFKIIFAEFLIFQIANIAYVSWLQIINLIVYQKSRKENVKFIFSQFKNNIISLNSKLYNYSYKEKINNFKRFLSNKTINEQRLICIKEIKIFQVEFLMDLQIDFEYRLNQLKKNKSMFLELVPLVIIFLLTLSSYLFGINILNKLTDSEFYKKYFGAFGIALLLPPLGRFIFLQNTLPMQIYEESIYILKKAINQHSTSVQSLITEDEMIEELIEREDYGLAKLIEEVDNDVVLSKNEALAYLELLKKDGLDS